MSDITIENNEIQTQACATDPEHQLCMYDEKKQCQEK